MMLMSLICIEIDVDRFYSIKAITIYVITEYLYD